MERYRSHVGRRATGLATVAAAALALAGCGTTVQLPPNGTGAALAGGTSDGLSVPSPTAPSTIASGLPSAVPGSATPTSTRGTRPASGTTSSQPVQSLTPTQASTASATGPIVGVTAKTINIGIVTADGFDKTATNLGFNVAVGSGHDEALAIVNYINRHGGMAGRKVVPVFYDLNVGRSTTNHPAEEQAACTSLTQDHHIYAVASAVGWNDTLFYDCLRKAGAISSVAGEAFDQQFFAADADYFYMPVEINMTRAMADNVGALGSAGFFTGWNSVTGHPGPLPVKIGLLRNDSPSDLAVMNQGVKPALARRGLSLTDSIALSANASQFAAQESSAVLKFKAEGITHVLSTFASPLLFMEAAQTQGYFPRYGLQSRDSPAAVLEGNAPKQQLEGSMGLGWQPYNDVDAAHDPGPPSPRAKLCLQLLRKAGQNTASRATALVGLWYCDTLFFLRDALAAAPNLSVTGFREGAESLHKFDAASTFQSGFAPGRLHDGAQEYRLFAYRDSCHCYSYVTPLRKAP
ncbi:MAG TPA: hypothetical protein VHC43_08905 [Mycobacteriales bacterium]|nr:hypothetical protein [Mycobacteriales bacterium]